MLFRMLKIQVAPDRLQDWLAFTRDTGFPAMLRQPGCRAIWRLRAAGSDSDYRVMTLWDGADDLDRFRASEARRMLAAAAAGLTIPPQVETLLDVVDDPPCPT